MGAFGRVVLARFWRPEVRFGIVVPPPWAGGPSFWAKMVQPAPGRNHLHPAMAQPVPGLDHLFLQSGGASLKVVQPAATSWTFVDVQQCPSIFRGFQ